MGVDLGFTVYGSRQAQAMADTAALDLSRYLTYADTLPNAQLQPYLDGKLKQVEADNSSNAVLKVVAGLWQNGTFTNNGFGGLGCQPTIAPPVRPGCNAIKVTAAQTVPQIFAGGFNVLNGHAGNAASGASIVVNTPEAGFSIGTYLANVNTQNATVLQQTAVLNVLLAQLGAQANVTAVGYEGLANTYVTLGQLVSASSGLLSANDVMTTSLTAQQWQGIWQNAVGTQVTLLGLNCSASPQPSACSAQTALSPQGLTFAPTTSVQLCQLATVYVNSTNYTCANGAALPSQGLNASVDVLQSLTSEAELSNGTNGVTLGLTTTGIFSDPPLNIANVNLALTLVSPAVVAYGPVLTTAKTAQVTANLSLSLSLLGLSLGTVGIDLTGASGTATLKSVNCTDNSMLNTAINVNTNALSTEATLTLGSGAPTPAAQVTVAGVVNASATYSGSVVPPTISTQNAGTNPYTVGSNTPSIGFGSQVLGLNLNVLNLLSTGSVLSTALGPVLQALGVTVAGAQVADLSTNCDAISIVQ
ncbi:MAG TPA: hypothetical protein VG346_14670 [Acidimicrobiales bacterium]|nr:hypothetical protein [Acidimicrobiales bacterium]